MWGKWGRHRGLRLVETPHAGVAKIESFNFPCIVDAATRAEAIRTELRNLPRDAQGNHLWPADGDAVPHWVQLLEELSAITGGCGRLPYRTRNDFESQLLKASQDLLACQAAPMSLPIVEKISTLDEIEVAMLPTVGMLKPALPGNEAAKRFLHWLRANNHTGAILASDLSKLYAQHAAAIGHIETSDRALRSNLITLKGVSSRQVSLPSHKGRIRPVEWTITPAETAVSRERVAA